MKLAIASGKGGTGKTTVALGLALSLAEDGSPGDGQVHPPLLMDCDVEAPDAHLFLQPIIKKRAPAAIQVPRIDPDLCSQCGDCAEVCRFNALALLGDDVVLFPELCHGCGSCTLICPEKAITEVPRTIGRMESGAAKGVQFAHGVLNVGEAMAVPVIRALKAWAEPQPGQFIILDAPPGTSCPVVETVMGADFVVLVTEPTPFGLHDLELAVEMLKELGLPAGVVVNRDGTGYHELDQFCALESLPILLRIPFDRGIAEGIARGKTLIEIRPEYRGLFRRMAQDIGEALSTLGSAWSLSPSLPINDLEDLRAIRQP
ncbi:ATP-binding protein [Gemmatimonadota bacterium]